ncbi:hypothetical protein Taro_016969 [Colocasia esculenta]|uniref:F-box domain-containing protein n=1 Tax=Colocasia esculenta TaxID=4460 RepID=A0A843UPY5_COLES|nr:hypothetical protein [Colocasia esculenta]
MAGRRDRLSKLPDPILAHILSLMPVAPARRTSILSSRWRELWKETWAPDFTGEVGRHTPDELVAIVDRYLQLHTNKKIRSFRLCLHPVNPYEVRLEQWVEFAVSRSVEELHLDLSPSPEIMAGKPFGERNQFKVPPCLFSSGSITHLSLGYCDLRPPVHFGSLPLLRSLSLRNVNIDDGMLRGILSNCLLLENLTLRECEGLRSIHVTSSGARLKRLVLVDCWDVVDLKISGPGLESFHFFGELSMDFSFEEVSSLVDVFVCSINRECSEPWHDYTKLLSDLAHVRILTLCPATLMRLTIWEEYFVEYYENHFPLRLENLRELQMLMPYFDAEYLTYMYGFFRLCPSPSLEKLFVRLPKLLEDPNTSSAKAKITEPPEGVQFDNLKVVKINNFKGSRCEMELVKFLLGRASNLEFLVLVSPQIPASDDDRSTWVECRFSESRIVTEMDLSDLHMKLLLLPKASSHVEIIMSAYSEDDSSLEPTHASLYCDADLYWLI